MVHENVAFNDAESDWNYTVNSQLDDTYKLTDSNDATLENFFSRPVKIATIDWSVGSNVTSVLNPWKLFFENNKVVNRITNFHLLRCNLKVKIILNGNGFHFGRAMASYLPLPESDSFTVFRPGVIEDFVEASQRPHVYLDPTLSQGGTLTLPFVWPVNALSIPNGEWTKMGNIQIESFAPLRHANGANDNVTISVFAWAEDVSLSVPTSIESAALVPQSEFYPQADEYGEGVVSKPASVVAAMAGVLTNVPVLAPYAKATEMVAGAVGRTAKLLGYSRPPVVSDIDPIRPTYFGNMSNVNVPDSTTKLSLDVKQELCVDPRTMGLSDTDEMAISHIAQRESYLTTFMWDVDRPPEDVLWNVRVGPTMWAENLDLTYNEHHLTASCFAALPFRNWKGSMRYRFQIVASAFHRGRLKITYDPLYYDTDDYNTNYIQIIDLAKERDFTIDVGWGSPQPFLNVDVIETAIIPYSTSPFIAKLDATYNGVLTVQVLNELTVPDSVADNDIYINVMCCACDDIEFANPTDKQLARASFFREDGLIPQSEFYPQAEQLEAVGADAMESAPVLTEQEPVNVMSQKLEAGDMNDLVFFGDPVASFRQCLKRYNLHTIDTKSSLSSQVFYRFVYQDFPYYRGSDPQGVDEKNAIPYNYCRTTLLNYLTPAYICRRGAIRYKVSLTGVDMSNDGQFNVTREPRALNVSRTATSFGSLDDEAIRRYFASEDNQPASWAGTVATTLRQNPVLEFELPYYHNRRFSYAKQSNFTTQNSQISSSHILAGNARDSTATVPLLHRYVSVGEDFNLAFYTGSPILYFYSNAL
jgi:hypothetical protein